MGIVKIIRLSFSYYFLHSSVGKESACDAGDPGSIPGLGRCLGEGNSNSLQYSWLENPVGRETWQATVHGVTRVRHDLVTKPLLFIKKVPGHCRDHGKPSSRRQLSRLPGNFPGYLALKQRATAIWAIFLCHCIMILYKDACLI